MKVLRVNVVLIVLIAISTGFFFLYFSFQPSAIAAYFTKLGMGEPLTVSLSGTGSMYPTFPKGTGKDLKELSSQTVATIGLYKYPTGITIFNKKYFQYILKRGDLVSFENNKTKEMTKKLSGQEHSLLKRIFALPGDVIQFRDGITYLNGKEQKEVYTAQPRSTFGGEFVGDCTAIKIPDNKIFVMGDNRKVSADSRSELGLVDFKDVEFFLPLEEQYGKYDKNWRVADGDLEESARIHIDKHILLSAINDMRRENNFKPLALNVKLDKSAAQRAITILKDDDLSYEATRSGYSVKSAMINAGYSNIIGDEFPLLGYYTTEEYIKAINEYPRLKQIFVNKDFQDIGVSELTENVNGCPKHVIVTHFGGYIPPDYTSEQIDSWRKLYDSLKSVKESWKKVTESGEFYIKNKSDADRILLLLDLRINKSADLILTMEKNKWFTQEQNEYIKKDPDYDKELDELTKKLNQAG